MRESNISTYGMSYNVNTKYIYVHIFKGIFCPKKKLVYEFSFFTIILGDISRNVLYKVAYFWD